MSTRFDLDGFLARHVTGRSESMFAADLAAHDAELRAAIEGASVLVIGGAGTIGSSFIRALLPFRPARLVVVDLSENGLTELTRDLRSTPGQFVPDQYLTYPISFGDAVFERMLRASGPFDIVAHFAAHKHVRSEKDRYSIEAMVENNVLSTARLLDLLAEFPPKHFFCVSTDKAANPANVMGASKKLMEEAVLAYSSVLPATTARFANVAFSNGSLPAGFLERIAKGQPLSAPSDVRRYFVSPAESGQLCLLACILGAPGDILFPRLEEPAMLTFSSIADALLAELGYTPVHCSTEEEARTTPPTDTTWPVYYFESDTSGEKSFEEFHTADEDVDLERFAALGVVHGRASYDVAGIRSLRDELRTLFSRDDLPKDAIVSELVRLVPTFQHVETGKSLDQKM
ncbi:polysaccharide biosynthesis protein [Salinibacterium soli]|uniref:Polysaccharide biosynthesis protein n=1 Tax=Antiquaquibacter soli TaxID=3064523 RepID=A0ABT9BS05_9MICO|nr:polysaccharide biosynthesis protein [Protaetiibacter sp. WY-16]MDO7883223.1 polysaccharide biosynthesis protein [Protaetiibacter sp. WY-16]